jgi:hypothetical protein
VFDGKGAVAAWLLRFPGGTVLRQGHFRAHRHSLERTIDEVLFGAAPWPAEAARDLVAGIPLREEPPAALTVATPPATAMRTLRLRARELGRTATAAYQGLFRHDDWAIGLVEAPIHRFLDPGFRPHVRWFAPPPGSRFAADPFGLEVDGRLQVVYEDFDYRTGLGVLAAFDAEQGVSADAPVPILDIPVHASYPYLLREEGQTYCLPETQAARELALHRAVEPPHRWEKVATLLRDVPAVDCSVFRHGGRWWIAGTRQDRGQNLNLHLWHAPALLGPWEPHAANPVKTDIRGARSGGTPFVHEGGLYRPAQDCSGGYGRRLVLQRVARLTPEEFREEPARVLDPVPGPYLEGIHTLSAVGARTLLDGKRSRFKPGGFRYAMGRGLAGARP